MTEPRPHSSTPLVSVAVPTFRRPDYLRRALESAVRQSYRHMEILVGDNANDKTTARVVRSFNDPRIRYIGRPENLGMVGNNLALFKEAKGEYLCNLHDDDFWEDDFLEKLVAPLRADPTLALAFSDHFVVDEDGRLNMDRTEEYTRLYGRDRLRPGKHAPAARLGLVDRNVQLVAALFRRNALDLEQFRCESANNYDLWLYFMALAGGAGAYYVPERLCSYRVHGNADSATQVISLDLNSAWCYEQFLRDARLKDLYADFRLEIGVRRTRAGTKLLHGGKPAEARPHLLSGLRYRPSLRALVSVAVSLFPASIARPVAGLMRGTLGAARQTIGAQAVAMSGTVATQPRESKPLSSGD